MCNNTIVYRPYRNYQLFSILFAAFYVAATILFGYSVNAISYSSFLLGIIAFLCGVYSRRFYIASKILVLFESDGLRIIGDKNYTHIYMSWQSIKTITRIKNYRGFYFYLLSPNTPSCRESKRIVNKGGMEQLYFDGNIVLGVDNTQNTENWEHLLRERSTKTDEEDGLRRV